MLGNDLELVRSLITLEINPTNIGTALMMIEKQLATFWQQIYFRAFISALFMGTLFYFSNAFSSSPKAYGFLCKSYFSENSPLKVMTNAEIQILQTLASQYASVAHKTDPQSVSVKESISLEFNKLHAQLKSRGVLRTDLEKLYVAFCSLTHQEKQRQARDELQEEIWRRGLLEQQRQATLNFVPIDGRKAVFHRIEPGTFMMGETRISTAFDLMATQTTQMIWRKVAVLANSKLNEKYEINVDPSEFKGDTRPVESVSAEDIQNWIDALNELSQAGEPALAELIPDHKQGDVYSLPTEAQWEFVVRGRGQYNDVYHFGYKEAQLDEYAWSERNSGNQTHPVAEKKPLVINGKEFFDMHGNVWELMADSWDGKSPLPGGVDPIGTEGSYRVIRGGSGFNPARYLHSDRRNFDEPGDRSSGVGFRLLRTSNRNGISR